MAQRARQRRRGLEFRGTARGRRRAQARDWLARVGLAGFEHRYPHQLSGGMKKRVALAQMLILDPQILLMDEPFSALDVQTRQLMENELLELWSANRKSVLFITHDLEEAISLVRSRDRAVGGPRDAPDRRVRDRPAAAARRRRDPDDAALRRAARRDLARDEGRSAEGLCAKPASLSRPRGLRSITCCCWLRVFAFWYALTTPGLVCEEFAKNTAFFFGKPLQVLKVIWEWFASGKIYPHLWVTLVETLLAFAVGSVLGLGVGLWLALSPTASALADPYIKATNAMPRVILAPIFAVWFGLGIVSKVALGVTLVFFIVFFNVYQGVKEVSPTVLANARMLGASRRQLLRTSTCRRRRRGCSRACTRRSAWRSSAPSSANISARRRASAT